MAEVSLAREDVSRMLSVSMDRMDAGDLEGAEQLATAATQIMPDAVGTWATLAVVTQEIARKSGKAFEGKEYLEKALAVRRMPQVMNDYANCIMYNERRYVEAADIYREAAIRHRSAAAAAHLAICLLMVANDDSRPETWREAWDWYEWRHMKSKLVAPDFEYRGEDVRGRTVLVNCEQGYGDQVFGMRFLKTLAERGARVVVLCDWNMLPLMRAQPYVAAAFDEAEPRELQCDFNVMLMSLAPYCLPECMPVRDDGYIGIKAGVKRHPRKRVGLCWQGSTNGSYPGWRNVPIDLLRRLIIARPDIDWISLQKDGKSGLPIDEASIGRCETMLDTARLVRSLDLVISGDTMIPHLAAGVGVPVWLMDRWSSSWQWTESGSRWYDLVHTYRQPAFGQWEPVIDEISHDLAAI